MKPLIILAILLVTASALWLYSDVDESDSLTVDESPSVTAAPQSTEENASAGVEATEIESAVAAESTPLADSPAADQAADIIQSEEPTDASPFEVVDGAVSEPAVEPAAVTESPLISDTQEQQLTDSDNAATSLEPVQVPSSYPVAEAAKYFIPKEERAPGRLGGPPPLDFPGGPSDPDQETNSAFQPPVAPGQ